MAEIASARGKTTRIDRQEHIEMLTFLTGVAKGVAQVSLREHTICGRLAAH